MKKLICALLACMLLISVPVSAATKDDLTEDLKETEAEKEAVQKEIDESEESILALKEEIDKLDEQIKEAETEIASIQREIDITQEELDKATEELEKAIQQKEEQKETLDERLRVMYMYSDTNIIELLFSSTSFSDLISKLDSIRIIAEYDKEVFDKLEAMEKEINAKKEEIEKEKANLLKMKKDSETKKETLNSIKVTRSDYMSELERKKEKLESELDSLEAESKRLESEINKLTSGSSGNNQQISSGGYVWPTSYYTYISSYYGNRFHPILGYYKFHSGVDIAVGGRTGVKALATKSGVVVRSEYNYGGYGNMVILDLGRDSNGNSVTAVYAHLRERYVSVGQSVSAGQAIGEVGTTGRSTGIHLHFEIRINGSTRNPLDYIG